MTDSPPVARFSSALPAMIDGIERLVACESPSADLDAVARSADVVTELGAAILGVEPERIVVDGRTHLRWRVGKGEARILLVGHHDTVWPLGSLDTHPFSVRDGVLRGPGCLDMKAGLVMAFYAMAAPGAAQGAAVTLLVTGDEEIGSPTSRDLVESEAKVCRGAFILEAAAGAGALKRERKGVSLYELRVRGRAAHAGLEPERGVNASVELAHQIPVVVGLASPAAGTTVTPTVLSAGTTPNTVPAEGRLTVDVRVRDAAEQARVDRAMRALRPRLAEAALEVTGGPNRPPMAAESSALLFGLAVRLASVLRIGPIDGVAVGGGSDGNFTAGVGTPTLDGLGAVGGGAHADHEYVLTGELPGRTALLAGLISELAR